MEVRMVRAQVQHTFMKILERMSFSWLRLTTMVLKVLKKMCRLLFHKTILLSTSRTVSPSEWFNSMHPEVSQQLVQFCLTNGTSETEMSQLQHNEPSHTRMPLLILLTLSYKWQTVKAWKEHLKLLRWQLLPTSHRRQLLLTQWVAVLLQWHLLRQILTVLNSSISGISDKVKQMELTQLILLILILQLVRLMWRWGFWTNKARLVLLWMRLC
jgi:hypothetical protein